MSALLALLACATTSAPEPTETRVVAIGPAVAQTALALAPDTVVGVDTASTELAAAEGLPHVGHARQVSAEGVLSLAPTRVLVTDSAGPADVLEQIEAAGVEVVHVPHDRSIEGVRTLIREVAGVVDADGTELTGTFDASCGRLPSTDAQTALFVYARGGGVMSVAGTDTAAHAMLDLAGLTNAVTAYEGYKPLTPEAVVDADPDWVVFTTRGLEASGGPEGLVDVPGLGQIDAVVEGRIATVDDFELLAFGLGTCKGAQALADAVQ